ncbi:MAG TPA: SBBP repeat-containing protein [Chloroflexia bacterium]|nr:SBBP repeat-containing protein [Chloroflexia bacterium]
MSGKIFKSLPNRRVSTVALLLATGLLWLAWIYLAEPVGPTPPDAAPDIAALPLSFEPNVGQTDPSVSFLARASGSTLYFTGSEVVIALQSSVATKEGKLPSLASAQSFGSEPNPPTPSEPSVLRLQFIGADAGQATSESVPLAGKVNYIRGKDKSKWHTNIATYPSIAYEKLYPGIDLHYSGMGGHLKGTYVVSARADPANIKWRYAGAQSTTLDNEGRLHIEVAAADGQPIELIEEAPVAWQEVGGKLTLVDARYELAGDGTVSFLLGAYNPAYALTIDPVIAYSTYLGSSGFDVCVAIAVRNGNAYVTGWTNSTTFPRQNPYDPTYNGGAYDVFVTQLSASGSALVYSTYLGGSDWDQAQSIAVDAQGNAYITGQTSSLDFPVYNAYQPAIGGFGNDAFVTKLDPTGAALVYSTYLGGSATDNGYRVALDTDGSALVTGTTYSANFPLHNPYQPARLGSTDAFVTRFTPNGQALTFSTYLGGTDVDYGNGIAIDALGRAYVVGYTFSTDFPVLNAFQWYSNGGSDAFVTRLNPDGKSLSYSTYLGGWGQEVQANDVAWVVTVDAAGNAYLAGETMSSNFPTRNPLQPSYGGGFQDAFVSKLNSAGNDLVFSTYLGGTGTDDGEGIAIDSAGQVYVGGSTNSPNFPTSNPISNHGRAFMSKFNTAGSDLLFSSRFGGTSVYEFGHAMTIDAQGSIYLAGDTESVDFPVVNPYQSFNRGSYDVFISKISEGASTATASPGTPTTLATNTPPTTIPSSTNTSLPTGTPTRTSTAVPSSPTSTTTPVPSDTPQATGTPTHTTTPPPTANPSSTSTLPPSATATRTATAAPTSTMTSVPSNTPQATGTPTFISTPPPTLTSTAAIGTATQTASASATTTPTATATLATSTPTVCTVEFADAPPGSTFYPFVRCLACRGVLGGYSDGTFRPGNDITRGQISKIVANAAAFNEPVSGQTFEDVPPDNTFYPFIERMSSRGIISGYPCGAEGEPCGPESRPYFRWGNNATRGQISKIVANAGGFSEPVSGQIFEDVPPSNPFYEFIQRLATTGIMSGYPCGSEAEPCGPENRPYFRWGNNATRGQTAKIVSNAFFPSCQTPARH